MSEQKRWFWTEEELQLLRDVYEARGLKAAQEAFPHRTEGGIQAMVKKLRLKTARRGRPEGAADTRQPDPAPPGQRLTTFADLLSRMQSPVVPAAQLEEALQVLKVLRQFIGRQRAAALEGLDRPEVMRALTRASQLIDGSRGVAVAGSPLGHERVPTRGHPAAATTRVPE